MQLTNPVFLAPSLTPYRTEESQVIELRCEGTLHGKLIDGRWFEVKCSRRQCGYRKGIIILHTIDTHSGKVVHTDYFAEPKNREERHNASDHPRTAVRAP